MKDGAYAVNLDKYPDIGTHWTALYALNNNFTYFENVVVEHISTEIIKFIENKNRETNIVRKQAYESVICGYFIRFIDYMLLR